MVNVNVSICMNHTFCIINSNLISHMYNKMEKIILKIGIGHFTNSTVAFCCKLIYNEDTFF